MLKAFAHAQAEQWPLVPALRQRTWMDSTIAKTAYRCLPLAIANMAGWWMISPASFRIFWTGGDAKESLVVQHDDPQYANRAVSHFGSGVLTFSVPYFFRTEYPYGLKVEGPSNFPIADMCPLTGIVETYGHVSTFTMNWKVTTVGKWIEFRPNMPVMQISLFDMSLLEEVDPEILSRAHNVDEAELLRWCAKRDALLKGKWPRRTDGSYVRHRNVDGSIIDKPHWTRFELANFTHRVDVETATANEDEAMAIELKPVGQPPEKQQPATPTMSQQLNRMRSRLLDVARLAYAERMATFVQGIRGWSAADLDRFSAEPMPPDVAPELRILMYQELERHADQIGADVLRWRMLLEQTMESL